RNGIGVLTITYGKSEKDKKKKIVEGNWMSGSLNGEVTKMVYYKNGDIEEYSGGYSDSDKNGEGTLTYTDKSTGEKRIEEGHFSEDSLTEGTKTYYDKKGNITKTEIYKNGTAVETEFAEEKEKSS
ncbi:MAG: hypothetical protein K6B74_05950, partial [Ruminococcus sp.]|nr:hypothetical protein [Ruminococcus sp.]